MPHSRNNCWENFRICTTQIYFFFHTHSLLWCSLLICLFALNCPLKGCLGYRSARWSQVQIRQQLATAERRKTFFIWGRAAEVVRSHERGLRRKVWFWPCFACPKLGDAGKTRVASKNREVLQKAKRSQFWLLSEILLRENFYIC